MLTTIQKMLILKEPAVIANWLKANRIKNLLETPDFSIVKSLVEPSMNTEFKKTIKSAKNHAKKISNQREAPSSNMTCSVTQTTALDVQRARI